MSFKLRSGSSSLIVGQAVSWTNGLGPNGYTLLSAERVQAGLGKAYAALVLPYLTGSQPIVAYQYADDPIAYVTVLHVPTIITLLIMLLLGLISAFCVPRLPQGVPRRDFGFVSHLSKCCD